MITFAAPWDTMTRTIVVKDPEFGDKDDLAFDNKVTDMMNGAIRTRISSPTPSKLVLEFIELSRVKALELRDFIVSSLGVKVRYIDYLGVHRMGYLTNEASLIVTGRGGGTSARQESSTTHVEFEVA